MILNMLQLCTKKLVIKKMSLTLTLLAECYQILVPYMTLLANGLHGSTALFINGMTLAVVLYVALVHEHIIVYACFFLRLGCIDP